MQQEGDAEFTPRPSFETELLTANAARRFDPVHPITYDKQFALSVSLSVLIGARDEHQQIHDDTVDVVSEGLLKELRRLWGSIRESREKKDKQKEKLLKESWALTSAWLGETKKYDADWERKVHKKLKDNPRKGSVFAYTMQYFIYHAINHVARGIYFEETLAGKTEDEALNIYLEAKHNLRQ